ncbi:hypothetical protein TWF694_010160 [Orbilia ellipsospora]|uniref:Uncharacterized protein n=1 Tax=Orbilia ellipsospora TaxID=2528407 RepID=A0AAV9XC57_9PEZI
MGIKSAIKSGIENLIGSISSSGSKPSSFSSSSSSTKDVMKGIGKIFGKDKSGHHGSNASPTIANQNPFVQGTTTTGHWSKKSSIVLAGIFGFIGFVAIFTILCVKIRQKCRKPRKRTVEDGNSTFDEQVGGMNVPVPTQISGISDSQHSGYDSEKYTGTTYNSQDTTPVWGGSHHNLMPGFGATSWGHHNGMDTSGIYQYQEPEPAVIANQHNSEPVVCENIDYSNNYSNDCSNDYSASNDYSNDSSNDYSTNDYSSTNCSYDYGAGNFS